MSTSNQLIPRRSLIYLFLVMATGFFLPACKKHDIKKLCIPCSASFLKEKKLRQITRYDSTAKLKEIFNYYYQLGLLDSIQKISYGNDDKTSSDDITTRLKVFYPASGCLPSAYTAKIYQQSMPVKMEKANMTISGDRILNKHLSFYADADFPVVNKTADIDYVYNAGGRVINRNGTDFGILIFPEIYGNTSSYTYTGNNISKVVTWKEQAGYDLNNLFDAANNPFNLQGGVLYYLSLRSYPDMEHFETLSRNANNPTQVNFAGTDISNKRLTINYTFTYSYTAGYPDKVNIVETRHDDVLNTTVITNLGTYVFQYY